MLMASSLPLMTTPSINAGFAALLANARRCGLRILPGGQVTEAAIDHGRDERRGDMHLNESSAHSPDYTVWQLQIGGSRGDFYLPIEEKAINRND